MLKFLFLTLLVTTTSLASTKIVLNSKNSISFNQGVTDAYVAKKSLEFFTKDLLLPASQPIYLILNTPGGSVMAGNQFIDFIKSSNRPVHTVVIFAASMGYQITQELGKRYILPSGTLMSHRGSISGISGQIPGELNARLKMIQDILEGMNIRAAKRVSMSLKAYQDAIVNELWTSGQHAVDTKHADDVAIASCDKSLAGTFLEDVATPFGNVSVEFSNCPLITEPVGFSLAGKKIASNSNGALATKKAAKKIQLEM
jgi:ATP-dependent Clp protease protease subunit